MQRQDMKGRLCHPLVTDPRNGFPRDFVLAASGISIHGETGKKMEEIVKQEKDTGGEILA